MMLHHSFDYMGAIVEVTCVGKSKLIRQYMQDSFPRLPVSIPFVFMRYVQLC